MSQNDQKWSVLNIGHNRSEGDNQYTGYRYTDHGIAIYNQFASSGRDIYFLSISFIYEGYYHRRNIVRKKPYTKIGIQRKVAQFVRDVVAQNNSNDKGNMQ